MLGPVLREMLTHIDKATVCTFYAYSQHIIALLKLYSTHNIFGEVILKEIFMPPYG